MATNNVRKNKLVPIAAALAAAVLAVSILAGQSLSAAASQQVANSDGSDESNQSDRPSWQYRLNKKFHEYEDGTFKVRAGAGGPNAPLTGYFPRDANIKVGETVVWTNPSKVGEPHTVTFIKDSAGFPPLEAPYVIEDAGALAPLDPSSNADPTVIPGPDGKDIVVVANARVYSPVAITEEAQYLPLNANYTMTGNESYVNSGLIWPEGQVPPGLPEITSFSVKFEKAGTYDYICVLHPWMTGRVTVS